MASRWWIFPELNGDAFNVNSNSAPACLVAINNAAFPNIFANRQANEGAIKLKHTRLITRRK